MTTKNNRSLGSVLCQYDYAGLCFPESPSLMVLVSIDHKRSLWELRRWTDVVATALFGLPWSWLEVVSSQHALSMLSILYDQLLFRSASPAYQQVHQAHQQMQRHQFLSEVPLQKLVLPDFPFVPVYSNLSISSRDLEPQLWLLFDLPTLSFDLYTSSFSNNRMTS